ncbi:MAG: VWA domain-containing protein [Rhodospirillales bacterium]
MPGEIDRTLVNFLRAVRGADVRVSVAETLDAVEVARFVGWENREALKQGLGLALAKTVEEKTRFDATFDAFFSAVANTADTEDEFDQSEETSSSDDVDDHLARLLLDGDRAELIAALEEAAAAVDLNEIRFFTQRGLYTQRILREMGVEGLDAAIREAQQAGGVGDGLGNGQGSGQRPGLAGDLEAARARLFESAKDLVERRLSIYGAETSRDLKESRLRRSKLGNLDRRDQEEMRRLVTRIAKRLAALHSRKPKRRNRGMLDLRRTMRKNYANDGIMFDLEWKRKKVAKPKVMAICDVSGSVAAVARFLLQFLYALHDILNDVRSFAFSGKLIETSDFFKRHDVEVAVDQVMNAVGYMSTDYGKSLEDFREGWLEDVDKRTTIVILGDGRSNNTEPRSDILKELSERSKRILWLNPEPPPLWGTGDSEIYRYKPYCNLMREVNTLQHLERIVNDLVKVVKAAS